MKRDFLRSVLASFEVSVNFFIASVPVPLNSFYGCCAKKLQVLDLVFFVKFILNVCKQTSFEFLNGYISLD